VFATTHVKSAVLVIGSELPGIIAQSSYA